tara:strand:+ start:140 stop:250 length:111 start_codon:yes stop_codon:yes gene_type:complete
VVVQVVVMNKAVVVELAEFDLFHANQFVVVQDIQSL